MSAARPDSHCCQHCLPRCLSAACPLHQSCAASLYLRCCFTVPLRCCSTAPLPPLLISVHCRGVCRAGPDHRLGHHQRQRAVSSSCCEGRKCCRCSMAVASARHRCSAPWIAWLLQCRGHMRLALPVQRAVWQTGQPGIDAMSLPPLLLPLQRHPNRHPPRHRQVSAGDGAHGGRPMLSVFAVSI